MTDAADWPIRFLEAWLTENPLPMNEHGQVIGSLPNAFLRSYYIECEVRRLRERLEAMPYEELAGSAGEDFKALLARKELASVLGRASGKARREGVDGEESKTTQILREYDRRVKAGLWTRESAEVVAGLFDCSAKHVRSTIKKFRPSKN